ncbi:hypothetical protein [Pseudogemmobacter bohemicus]|uniref:hypothetical protein n=1 Tax=Pseudogemmobacter bohemicus TaxID=2250708 RepID=UPI00130076C0|nr:hypothetical protein [Pseudogemmobacter bohemicus]
MKLKAGLIMLALSGCVAPVVVTDFNGDSVTVQGPGTTPDGEAARIASQTCATRNRVAHYASSRQIHAPQYPSVTYAHLYLCNPVARFLG